MITESICKEDPELASHRMKYICVALQVSHLSHNHLGRKPRKKHPFILILGIAQIEEGNLALINFYNSFILVSLWYFFGFILYLFQISVIFFRYFDSRSTKFFFICWTSITPFPCQEVLNPSRHRSENSSSQSLRKRKSAHPATVRHHISIIISVIISVVVFFIHNSRACIAAVHKRQISIN